ncbi:MAG: lytic transglycosylase domain-containing protein [Mailhella sp.]|nr:lytic transglycosylase domain-containing protein [Mailhella sp.]
MLQVLPFCAVFTSARAGAILSEDISISERSALESARPHEYLVDSMDLAALSPHAHLLMRPMVTPQLALAMRSGKIKTPSEEWQRIIRKASAAYALPEDLIAAVIHTESRFQADAVSPKGAQGAMQIMPSTQAALGLIDPFDPEANVMAGCAFLKKQIDAFGDIDLALAAYNAGPANVKKYGGIPPFPETMAYVRLVNARRSEVQEKAPIAVDAGKKHE